MGEASLSKGCFVHKSKQNVDPFSSFKQEVWDSAFNEVWLSIESKLKVHKDEISSHLMNDLVGFTKSAEPVANKIPTAILLTGVNLPDHGSMFSQIVLKLKKNVTSYVSILYPHVCSTIKSTIEVMAGQFMNNESLEYKVELMDIDDSDEEESSKAYKKSSCNMPNLAEWYTVKQSSSPSKKSNNSNSKLVVILPDVEGLSPKVLHDFLLILSCYISKLPLVVVLGVATTASVIGDMLEHSVTSKLSVQIFQSQRSVYFLNNVLDKVFLTKDCPFQLGPKILKFLVNTFLFYDFSVQKFTLGIKFCIMDHFLQQPYKMLCTDKKNIKNAIKKLTKTDLDSIRQLGSFKLYLETQDESEKDLLLTDNSHLKKVIEVLLKNCRNKLLDFYVSLKVLQILVSQLPGAPLGKQIRELYLVCMSGGVTKSAGYKECIQLLNFQAKSQLLDKLDQIIKFMEDEGYQGTILEKCQHFKMELENIDSNKNNESKPPKSPQKINIIKSRAQFKEVLAAMSKSKPEGGFEQIRERLVEALMKEQLPPLLEPITTLPLHEILVADTTASHNLKNNLIGCPRGDVHHALTQPSHYLMCDCCKVEDANEIPSTLPDICIAYKLHLECGALINLHDWLQTFSTIVDPDTAGDEKMEINPVVQARFMQAVSDLEFMGFVKSSKRKADHVSRMTWGGSA